MNASGYMIAAGAFAIAAEMAASRGAVATALCLGVVVISCIIFHLLAVLR